MGNKSKGIELYENYMANHIKEYGDLWIHTKVQYFQYIQDLCLHMSVKFKTEEISEEEFFDFLEILSVMQRIGYFDMSTKLDELVSMYLYNTNNFSELFEKYRGKDYKGKNNE